MAASVQARSSGELSGRQALYRVSWGGALQGRDFQGEDWWDFKSWAWGEPKDWWDSELRDWWVFKTSTCAQTFYSTPWAWVLRRSLLTHHLRKVSRPLWTSVSQDGSSTIIVNMVVIFINGGLVLGSPQGTWVTKSMGAEIPYITVIQYWHTTYTHSPEYWNHFWVT